MGHAMRMATAYETCNGQEAPYTNYTEDFKASGVPVDMDTRCDPFHARARKIFVQSVPF